MDDGNPFSTDLPVRRGRDDVDPLLRMLIGLVTTTGISISVMLLTHGGVIHGSAINRKEWLELWTELLSSTNEIGKTIAEEYGILAREGSLVIDSDHSDNDVPQIVYLKDAIFPGVTQGVLARVSMKSVVSWSLEKPSE